MSYPAIVYRRDYVSVQHADNVPYRRDNRYEVCVIDYDPDSPYPDLIGGLSSAKFDRDMVVDKLYHTYYSLYF